jgi:hypothetical protein
VTDGHVAYQHGSPDTARTQKGCLRLTYTMTLAQLSHASRRSAEQRLRNESVAPLARSRKSAAVIGRSKAHDLAKNASKSADVAIPDAQCDVVDACAREFQHLPRACHAEPLLVFAGRHSRRLNEASQECPRLQAGAVRDVGNRYRLFTASRKPMLCFQDRAIAMFSPSFPHAGTIKPAEVLAK